MAAVRAGELWTLRIDSEFRRVKVIGPAGKRGWWRCVDLATDIYVLARENCFAERQGGGGPTRAHGRPTSDR
ncbi:MAG TPA: hypothetical protein VG826_16785 [Pirellulales bacterium]|nr:hypothetical protein [Pirellulales bacterium]